MARTIIDIETARLPELPDPPEKVLNAGVGNMVDEKKIAIKRAANRQKWLDSAPLVPLNGQIIAIGIMPVDEYAPCIFTLEDETEEDLLARLWAAIAASSEVVGYNVMDFDLAKFLRQRTVAHGRKGAVRLNLRRYSTDHIIDLMQLWANWDRNEYVSLSYLAERLGLPTKPYGDGAEVAGWYDAGEWGEIRKHCEADILMTRDLYNLMQGVYF
jgi:predicted PolB exonuclease-like 3'-5' exonuclease